jgi:hypothetical protein
MDQVYPINYVCCVRTEPSTVAAFSGTHIHKKPHVLDVSRKSGLSYPHTSSLSLSARNSLHAPGSLVVCVCTVQGCAVMPFGLHEGAFSNQNNKAVGGQDRGTHTPFQAKLSREQSQTCALIAIQLCLATSVTSGCVSRGAQKKDKNVILCDWRPFAATKKLVVEPFSRDHFFNVL